MANKLDQLFRENLDQLEMKPSVDSWSQVKDQLAGKKSMAWVRPVSIAAAVAMLFTAAAVVLNLRQDDAQPIMSAMDHPVADHPVQIAVEMPAYLTESKGIEPEPQIGKESVIPVSGKEEQADTEEAVEFVEIPVLQLAKLNEPKMDIDMTPGNPRISEDKVKEEESYIRITYIASSEKEPEGSGDGKKLDKVLSLARELSSSDVLADFREAKDNLFRKNN